MDKAVRESLVVVDDVSECSDGLCIDKGELVGVLDGERIGEERFSLLRISCSYDERS